MRVEVGNLTKKIPYSQSVRALERKWWICDGQNQCGNSRLPSYSPTHSQSWTEKIVWLDLRDPIFRGPICLKISWRRCIKCPGWIRSNRQINYGENLPHDQVNDHHGIGVKTNDSPASSTITLITITVTTERGGNWNGRHHHHSDGGNPQSHSLSLPLSESVGRVKGIQAVHTALDYSALYCNHLLHAAVNVVFPGIPSNSKDDPHRLDHICGNPAEVRKWYITHEQGVTSCG